MEAFSLLKYWRSGAAGVCIAGDGGGNARSASASTTTIVTAVSEHSSETDDEEEEEGDNDDGPFFDLEFAVTDEDDGDGQVKDGEHDDEEKIEGDGTDSDGSDGEDDGREMKFTLSSASSGDSIDPNVSLSPSDDLFFKGRLVPIEPSSLVFNGTEANSKSQFPVSLVKSATKFRVLMLKLKKSKSNVAEKTESNGSGPGNKKEEQKPPAENKQSQSQSKLFTVKFKVEEVPIVSLFTRDNSSKVAISKAQKQNSDESASEEKRFSKDVMQRYLKKVKPFYVRASKRYGEKMRFSGQLNLAKAGLSSPPCVVGQKSPPAKLTAEKTEAVEVTDAPLQGNAKSQRQGNLPAGLRVVCKHLGKSRSASSAVAAAPAAGPVVSKRRDDSLLQQQDGIQSAILHCKRSFKASRDSESSMLSRSVSDQSQEKMCESSRSEIELALCGRVLS